MPRSGRIDMRAADHRRQRRRVNFGPSQRALQPTQESIAPRCEICRGPPQWSEQLVSTQSDGEAGELGERKPSESGKPAPRTRLYAYGCDRQVTCASRWNISPLGIGNGDPQFASASTID